MGQENVYLQKFPTQLARITGWHDTTKKDNTLEEPLRVF